MREKYVAWAYPTSTYAEKRGYGKTGCWIVETAGNLFTDVEVTEGFSSLYEAYINAEIIPLPWKSMLTFFPLT